jgi:hypothetical protein
MSNHRTQPVSTYGKAVGRLKTITFDQHFKDTLHRTRREFKRTGQILPVFECVTENEVFQVPANWPDNSAKPAACALLRDTFRRRGVYRYVFICEAWVGKTPGLRPTDDHDRDECVQVIAVERNGARRCASAEITRDKGRARLGHWNVNDAAQGWLFELLEEGYSDRASKIERPPVGRLSSLDLHGLVHQDPQTSAEFRDSLEIHARLGTLIADHLQRDAGCNLIAIYLALESVVLGIVKDMGSKSVGEFARVLRDYPDKFPMFSTVSNELPSAEHVRLCTDTLRRFRSNQRGTGHALCAIFGAFMNMYMNVGSRAIGALDLAECIETWDPEHQARLRELGLRSSFELEDDEGHVFFAISAEGYPTGVIGRHNAVGDLFVRKVISFRFEEFATAVDKIQQTGAELVLGSQAKELLDKMHQVKGIAPQSAMRTSSWQ